MEQAAIGRPDGRSWAEVLAAVDQPIERASGLPNIAYTGRDHMIDEHVATLAERWSDFDTGLLRHGGPALPRFPNLPAKWHGAADYVALFPNLLLGIHCDHFYSVRLEPVGPERTVEHFEIYYVGEEPLGAAYAGVRAAVAANWREVFAEDVSVVQKMQYGRASAAFQGGIFTPVLEPSTHCFHVWMARAPTGAGE